MALTTLLGRWSRRDRLAVALVAVTVAFLVGTTLVVVATGDATTAVAAEFDDVGTVETYADPAAARAAAGPSAVVLPVARLDDGPVDAVVGIPDDRPAWLPERAFEAAPETGIALVDPARESATIEGTVTSRTVPIAPRSNAVVPDGWATARPSLVSALGPTGAVVLSPPGAGADGTTSTSSTATESTATEPMSTEPTSTELTSAGSTATPLRGAAAFFAIGSAQALGVLAILAAGVGLLVAVVVFAVVRTTARARRRTIFVARATGATRRSVLAVFARRGAALSLVGIALGYALGVVGVNLAVNVGVALGLPTSLSPTVGPTAAVLLGAIAGVVVLLGTVAAVLAVRPLASRHDLAADATAEHAPDAASPMGERRPWRRWLDRLAPRIVTPRALVPMVVTLATFAVVALLLVAGASAAAPLSGGGATVVEPGAAHPIASSVPVAYAAAIEDGGARASPEILAFTVVDGDPVVVRGADFDRFAAVSDADLVAGRPPAGDDEALIGADLARTLDVGRGEAVTLGGSTRPAFATVDVVGIYAAPGPYDDALLVSPDTARHLAGVPDDSVQFVRIDERPASTGGPATPSVVSIQAEPVVASGANATVTAIVFNPASSVRTHAVSLAVDGTAVAERSVSVGPLSTATVRIAHAFDRPGNRTLSMGATNRSISVVPPDAPRLGPLPERIPVDSEPTVTVRTVAGRPIADATVTVDGRSYPTGPDGTVRVPVSTAGTRTLVVAANGERIRRSIEVVPGGRRTLVGSLSVSPRRPDLLTSPRARLTVSNPWNVTRSATVALTATDEVVLERSMSLDPGESRTITRRLPRRGPGTSELVVRADGERVASTNFTVRSNRRLTSALSTTDAAVAGGGLGAGLATVIGNLTLVAGTLVVFAGVLAVGSVGFALSSAVAGRRRTLGIHRATGAGPRHVARLLVGDAVRLSVVAVPVAIAAGLGLLLALDAVGRLVVFGVRLDPLAGPLTLGAIALGSVAVVVTAAVVVGVAIVRSSPAALLDGDAVTTRAKPDGDVTATRANPNGDATATRANIDEEPPTGGERRE